MYEEKAKEAINELEKHLYFVDKLELENKYRLFFEEEIGEKVIKATIQIPLNEEAKFIYYISTDENIGWFKQLVSEYEGVFLDKEMIIKEEIKNLKEQNDRGSEIEKQNLEIPITIKGVIRNEKQRKLIKELLQNKFDVFQE